MTRKLRKKKKYAAIDIEDKN